MTEIVAANVNPLPPAPEPAPPSLSFEDQDALRRAVTALERPSFAARLSAAAGAPLDLIGRSLPTPVMDAVAKATESAMLTSLRVALKTIPQGKDAPEAAPAEPGEVTLVSAEEDPPKETARDEGGTASKLLRGLPALARSSVSRFGRDGDLLHKAMAAASGAIGGLFGLTTLAVELPVSTTIMLRSIARIAQDEGEDLADPDAALACVQVFALGGRGPSANLAESGYFAVRGVMAKTLSEAVRYAGERGLAGEGAPALIRFATQVAARFGVVVSQKVAAQAVPVIGALGGAAVNTAFMDHFQSIARAHFTVRRLERTYGRDAVRAAYDQEREFLGAASA